MPSSDPKGGPIELTPSSSDGAIETDCIVDAMEQAESQELQRISNALARSIAELIPSLSTLREADRITSLETMLLRSAELRCDTRCPSCSERWLRLK